MNLQETFDNSINLNRESVNGIELHNINIPILGAKTPDLNDTANPNKCYILAMGGGFSRGAWQAGAVHGLARYYHDNKKPLRWDIITGVGVGAINGMFSQYSDAGDELEWTYEIASLWPKISKDVVAKCDYPFSKIIKRWITDYIKNRGKDKFSFICNTRPLKKLINILFSERKRKSNRGFTISTFKYSDYSHVVFTDETTDQKVVEGALLATISYPLGFPFVNISSMGLFATGGFFGLIDIESGIRRCIQMGKAKTTADVVIDFIAADDEKLLHTDLQMTEEVANKTSILKIVRQVFKSLIITRRSSSTIYKSLQNFPDITPRHFLYPTNTRNILGKAPYLWNHEKFKDIVEQGFFHAYESPLLFQDIQNNWTIPNSTLSVPPEKNSPSLLYDITPLSGKSCSQKSCELLSFEDRIKNILECSAYKFFYLKIWTNSDIKFITRSISHKKTMEHCQYILKYILAAKNFYHEDLDHACIYILCSEDNIFKILVDTNEIENPKQTSESSDSCLKSLDKLELFFDFNIQHISNRLKEIQYFDTCIKLRNNGSKSLEKLRKDFQMDYQFILNYIAHIKDFRKYIEDYPNDLCDQIKLPLDRILKQKGIYSRQLTNITSRLSINITQKALVIREKQDHIILEVYILLLQLITETFHRLLEITSARRIEISKLA
ncbi:uncharacterized protein CMU_015650 [Cryptosporidium muris RN66]|uniref:PNPLA domain-containing protein n=1 Tax=Cryptosporidium muris (strain RN66) TaxID=441375 RepID=B6ACG4_CRYMR|nr:uncharacterized protein CMU_015650 [Cryptosporidium muris RN66]EEA05818.1 hypothetical protein, conserved [Cryptosporidium muris RN66]|eukprot:XP_002140167.1 hypothetical protein [Cryptosporidium muris RN66]